MRRLAAITLGSCVLCVAASTVHAQAARSAGSSALAPAERALLERGEVSRARHIGGSVSSIVLGFGSGHAIQGRWRERGWIFTVGELASVALFVVASSESDLDTSITNVLGVAGIGGLVGFHVWGAVDAIIAPSRHNRRVRALRQRVDFSAFATPLPADDGAIVGITARF
jgi:hypothetical protein